MSSFDVHEKGGGGSSFVLVELDLLGTDAGVGA